MDKWRDNSKQMMMQVASGDAQQDCQSVGSIGNSEQDNGSGGKGCPSFGASNSVPNPCPGLTAGPATL